MLVKPNYSFSSANTTVPLFTQKVSATEMRVAEILELVKDQAKTPDGKIVYLKMEGRGKKPRTLCTLEAMTYFCNPKTSDRLITVDKLTVNELDLSHLKAYKPTIPIKQRKAYSNLFTVIKNKRIPPLLGPLQDKLKSKGTPQKKQLCQAIGWLEEIHETHQGIKFFDAGAGSSAKLQRTKPPSEPGKFENVVMPRRSIIPGYRLSKLRAF